MPAVGADPHWWQEAVFYQVYPLSFCLADPVGRAQRLAHPVPSNGADLGSGSLRQTAERAGDLEGIRRQIDYLRWLGIDALWLSPTQPSPMADYGYDVADYRDVDPLFGSLELFDALVADVHAAGMRIIMDMVPNHSSDRHPWFIDSRSSRSAAKRDWYYWRPGRPGGAPPNNWIDTFEHKSAWTLDPATNEWYLHLFLPAQPELNWGNAAMAAEIEGAMGWWLDRGVDGFRIDVVHALGKDPALPDAPPGREDIPWSGQNDDPRTHPILRSMRKLADAHPGDPVTVGEVFLLDTAKVAKYYGNDDELHLAFNFPPMFCEFEAACFRERISEVEELLPDGTGGWPTWVLSSHDRPRARTRYGGPEARARAAAVLMLTLRGTPFLFAGEELGLEDALPAPKPLDPGGRDGCRAPIPWDGTPAHGWALGGAEPWLPWPPEAATRNVASLRDDESSILHLYRRILAERKRSPALRHGSLRLLESPPDVIAYERRADRDERLVVINFGKGEERFAPASGRTVLVSSADPALALGYSAAAATCDGRIAPESALVLGPG
jgi:alpha-glucosidase